MPPLPAVVVAGNTPIVRPGTPVPFRVRGAGTDWADCPLPLGSRVGEGSPLGEAALGLGSGVAGAEGAVGVGLGVGVGSVVGRETSRFGELALSLPAASTARTWTTFADEPSLNQRTVACVLRVVATVKPLSTTLYCCTPTLSVAAGQRTVSRSRSTEAVVIAVTGAGATRSEPVRGSYAVAPDADRRGVGAGAGGSVWAEPLREG